MTREWWSRLYEGEFGTKWFRPYRINPCDADAFAAIKPFGRVIARLATQCQCCSGFRVLFAMLAGAYWQMAFVWGVLGVLGIATVVEYIWGDD
jgi:hypothetical protein